MSSRLYVDAKVKPALNRLPALNESDVDDHAPKHDAPFPRQALVLEHVRIHKREIDHGKSRHEARHDRPKQKTIVVHRLEHGKRTGKQLVVHGKQAAVEVLHLPGGDEEEEAERGKRGRPGAEDGVAKGRALFVAAGREVVVAAARGRKRDQHKRGEAQASHKGAVHELVADEVLGEDAGAEAAWWSAQNVPLRLFEAEAERQGRRGDEVGPQDFERREGKDADAFRVPKGETNEEKNDLGEIRGE